MLHLTPENVEAGYKLLLTTPPFKGWKFPPADDVIFYVKAIDRANTHGTQGQYWFDGTRHHLQINPHRHHTLASMLMTLAHEMVHMRESMLSLDRGAHGRHFQKLATQVCKSHGFDRGQF